MSEAGHMAISGEDIPAECACFLSKQDGKVYTTIPASDGAYIGDAVEQIREGFRVSVENGEVREDDA